MGRKSTLDSLPEIRRKTFSYRSVPEIEENLTPVGRELYDLYRKKIIFETANSPVLSLTRFYWGEFLRTLIDIAAKDYFPTTHHDSSPDLQGIIDLAKLLLTSLGYLDDADVASIQGGEHIRMIDPQPKYKTYSELEALSKIWEQEKKIVGMVHGAFDPPHGGHGRTFAMTYPYCDVLLVPFDSNTLLRHRKSREGDIRPRYPQLAWRMWEVASLPVVDYVFVSPVLPGSEDKQWAKLYKGLNIRILGAASDNTLLPTFTEEMSELGGHVIYESPINISSTKLMNEITDGKTPGYKTSIDRLVEIVEERALRSGFLRDYPNGT